MYITATFQFQAPPAVPEVPRGSLVGGHPDMTPFVELPADPNWPAVLRSTLAEQSDEFFQNYLPGRPPTPQEKREQIERMVFLLTPIRKFQNNLYLVEILHTPPVTPTYIHLAITRLDEGTCNEWADLQRIKNEIVGPEYEAVELFPAESRLVNAGNQYHLWVHSDPAFRFPIGWNNRTVLHEPVKIKDGPLRMASPLDNTAALVSAPTPLTTLSALVWRT